MNSSLAHSAVILGRSQATWQEFKAAEEQFGKFDLVLATKRAGRDYDGRVDHWISFHPELFEPWLAARRKAGRPEPGMMWTGIYRGNKLGRGIKMPLNWVKCDGGASGLLAVMVGLTVAKKMILCGVPMDAASGRYDDTKQWAEAPHHQRQWEKDFDLYKDRVRSMSGWSQKLLGAPTKEWFDAS